LHSDQTGKNNRKREHMKTSIPEQNKTTFIEVCPFPFPEEKQYFRKITNDLHKMPLLT